MSDAERWVDSEGPEAERIQRVPDTWHGLPSLTPEEEEAMARQFFEKLDATMGQRGELKGAAACVVSAGLAVSPLARAEGEREAVEEGLTVRSPTFDERAVAAPPAEPIVAALPAEPVVAAPPAEPPSLPVNAPEPRPPAVRPVQDLTITSVALDIPPEIRELMGRLPFLPRAPGPELARTMKVPVHNPRQGQTAPLGDDSIEKAEAVLPFVGNTVGAALVPFPRLSLEQYASLRAELLVWPERWVEILSRYHVMNAAVRRALEEHWHFEFVASPEARATFDQLLADYTAWLRTQRLG